MSTQEHHKWVGYSVRFLCGFAIGFFIAFKMPLEFILTGSDVNWWAVLLIAAISGVVSALFGDWFWDSFIRR